MCEGCRADRGKSGECALLTKKLKGGKCSFYETEEHYRARQHEFYKRFEDPDLYEKQPNKIWLAQMMREFGCDVPKFGNMRG